MTTGVPGGGPRLAEQLITNVPLAIEADTKPGRRLVALDARYDDAFVGKAGCRDVLKNPFEKFVGIVNVTDPHDPTTKIPLLDVYQPSADPAEPPTVKNLSAYKKCFAYDLSELKDTYKKIESLSVSDKQAAINKFVDEKYPDESKLSDDQKMGLKRLLDICAVGNDGTNKANNLSPGEAKRSVNKAFDFAISSVKMSTEAGQKRATAKWRTPGAWLGSIVMSRAYTYGEKWADRRAGTTDKEVVRGTAIGGALGTAALAGAVIYGATRSWANISHGIDLPFIDVGGPSSSHSVSETVSAASPTATPTSGDTAPTYGSHLPKSDTPTYGSHLPTSGAAPETPDTTPSTPSTPETPDTTPPDENPDQQPDAGTPTPDERTAEDVLQDVGDKVDFKVTVVHGDTLSQLSLDHLEALKKEAGLKGSISQEELHRHWDLVAKKNGIKDPNLIYPGQTIKWGDADREMLDKVFSLNTDGDNAVLKPVPDELHQRAEIRAEKMLDSLPTGDELASGLEHDKIEKGEGLYHLLGRHGVTSSDIQRDLMVDWLDHDAVRKSLTSTDGQNPMMYVYEGSNGTELRLSAPGKIPAEQQQQFVDAYQGAIAHEQDRLTRYIVSEMLRQQGLDPDDYALAS